MKKKLLIAGTIAVVSGIIGYIIARKKFEEELWNFDDSDYDYYEDEFDDEDLFMDNEEE